MDELMENATKIRKRGGCSPSSSSTSSMVRNYRLKRGILGSKKKSSGRMVGMGRRSPSVILPRQPPSLSDRSSGQAPMSARKLGATLWEMNEVPTPRAVKDEDEDDDDEEEVLMVKRVGWRENTRSCGYLPLHLSHTLVSERMERSQTGSRTRRESTISRRSKTDHLDTVTNASSMEIETRSQCPSLYGSKSGLKDVSNALRTSKELLKIISRMWGQEDFPSSRTSLIAALHTELGRACLQINQLLQEERPDNKDIKHLVKLFAEEKATWKDKEQDTVEAAVKSMARELEVERKLRKRAESLNKKLGKELAETKASYLKVVKELEAEKKSRVIVEQVCDELAVSIGEERTQMKIKDAKHQFEEKREAINLRNEAKAFLIRKNIKEDGHNSAYHRRDGNLSFFQSEAGENSGENLGDSDPLSIQLNVNDPSKNFMTPKNSERKSIFNQVARRSTSLLRSVSNIVQWGNGSNHEIEKLVGRRSCGDEVHRHKPAKGVRDHILTSTRFGLEREISNTSNQQGPTWSPQEPFTAPLNGHVTMEGTGMRGRGNEDRPRR